MRPTGSKQFVQIVRIDGRRYERGLGGCQFTALDEARETAFETYRRVRHGENPFVGAGRAAATPTFEDAMEAVIAIQSENWRGAKTEAQWRSSLREYAAAIMPQTVDAVRTPDVLAILEPIWSAKRNTARSVKQRIHAVMQWAVAKGHRQDNPVDAVDAVLPRNGKGVKPHAALPWAEVPAVLRKVDESDAHLATKLAFKFLVLTAARSGEVCQATWDEVDDGLWVVPKEHMKAGKEHVVPLSKAALRVLDEASDEYGEDGLVFPSKRGGMLYDGAFTRDLLRKQLGIEATTHGFRSSFRNWAAEHGWEHDVAEAALAHSVGSATELAYKRTDYLDKRRKMMKAWAKFCTGDEERR